MEKENNNPLISVIVPIYNVEQYLRKCVDSILAQTYQNLELILIDDGSPDGCPKICDEYAEMDSRVKVIHKHNGGLSDARNAGLDVATGEFISFIDSDDYVAENFIEKLYEAIKENNADISFCNFSCVEEEGKRLPGNAGFRNFSVQENTVLDEENFWELYFDVYITCVVAWNKLYNCKVFCGIRFPVGKINEDEFILHHATQRCNRFVAVNNALYFYMQRQNSITGSISKKINFDAIEALEERYKYFIQKEWYTFADTCMRQIFALINSREKKAKKIFTQYKENLKALKKTSKHKHNLIFIIDNILFFSSTYNFFHHAVQLIKPAITKTKRKKA